jgi:hypothetical protein
VHVLSSCVVRLIPTSNRTTLLNKLCLQICLCVCRSFLFFFPWQLVVGDVPVIHPGAAVYAAGVALPLLRILHVATFTNGQSAISWISPSLHCIIECSAQFRSGCCTSSTCNSHTRRHAPQGRVAPCNLESPTESTLPRLGCRHDMFLKVSRYRIPKMG